MTEPAYQVKKGGRTIQRHCIQANEKTDLHSSEGVLMPKDLPVTSILDKPVPKIGLCFALYCLLLM